MPIISRSRSANDIKRNRRKARNSVHLRSDPAEVPESTPASTKILSAEQDAGAAKGKIKGGRFSLRRQNANQPNALPRKGKAEPSQSNAEAVPTASTSHASSNAGSAPAGDSSSVKGPRLTKIDPAHKPAPLPVLEDTRTGQKERSGNLSPPLRTADLDGHSQDDKANTPQESEEKAAGIAESNSAESVTTSSEKKKKVLAAVFGLGAGLVLSFVGGVFLSSHQQVTASHTPAQIEVPESSDSKTLPPPPKKIQIGEIDFARLVKVGSMMKLSQEEIRLGMVSLKEAENLGSPADLVSMVNEGMQQSRQDYLQYRSELIKVLTEMHAAYVANPNEMTKILSEEKSKALSESELFTAKMVDVASKAISSSSQHSDVKQYFQEYLDKSF